VKQFTPYHARQTYLDNTIPCKLFSPDSKALSQEGLEFEALLDTGALNSNYISVTATKIIQTKGMACIQTNSLRTCSAFDGVCTQSLGILTLQISIYNEKKKHAEFYDMQFKLLNLDKYDLIIGRQDIQRYDLTQVCRSQFVKKHKQSTPNTPYEALFLTQAAVNLVGPGSHDPRNHSHEFSQATCFVLEDKGEEGQLRKHIHELVGKNEDELDQLTVESMELQKEIEKIYDQYADPEAYDKEMCAQHPYPTQVYIEIKRHEELFIRFSEQFSRHVKSEPASIPPMVIEIDEEKWKSNSQNRLPPRPQSAAKQNEIVKQVATMQKLNVIRTSQAEQWSQVHMVPKPNNKWRFCEDVKNLNACTKSLGFPIPNIKMMTERIGASGAKYYAVIDLTSGYHQAPLAAESSKWTAFITLIGLFEWLRVPMGCKGSAPYFQHALATIVLAGLLYFMCELYLDDILVYGRTLEEYFGNLEKVFERLKKYKLTVNPDKGKFGMQSVDYVGHHFSPEGVTHNRDRIEKVLQIDKPVYAGQLKSFLGVAEYFHDHIQNMSDKLRPLRLLIQPYDKRQILKWTSEAEQAFEQIKKDINDCPTLYFIDPSAPIYLNTDASQYGIGGYLYQVIDTKEHPIIFMSKSLITHEINWSTIEKECYAIVYSLFKFSHLLQDTHFILKTDHQNLTYMSTNRSQRVQRWLRDVQAYDMIVEHIPGKDNIVADGLSRIMNLSTGQLNALEEHQQQCYNVYESDKIKLTNQQYKYISSVHNSLVGHAGVEKTLERLKRLLTSENKQPWEHMRMHVREFIKRKCPFCQKMSHLKLPIETIKFTAATYNPMQRVNIDTINLDHADENGNKYIIVAIDCFSRLVDLYAVPDLSSEVAAQALLDWISRYGVPEEIQTDQGTQYVNEIIEQLIKMLGSTHKLNISAHSKEENAIVERANKEVMRHLRALIFERNVVSNWSKNIPLVRRIINTSVHESIGCSPASIIFGNAVDLDRGIFLPFEERPFNISLPIWLDAKLKAQDAIIYKAQQIQKIKDAEHLSTTAPNLTVYNIGDYVLVEYPATNLKAGPPSKLLTNLRGPMKVISKMNSNYKLEDLITGKIESIHIKRIHPFYYDPTIVDPRLIANRDQQMFDIEEIISHEGNRYEPKTMKFQVRWAPINDQPNAITWESLKTLRSAKPLHEYLVKHKMKSLIPPIFKEHYK